MYEKLQLISRSHEMNIQNIYQNQSDTVSELKS
jgi:hypothetical protein